MLCFINQLFRDKSDLKLEGLVISALRIIPLATGEIDSLSILFVPVFPMWGKVKVII